MAWLRPAPQALRPTGAGVFLFFCLGLKLAIWLWRLDAPDLVLEGGAGAALAWIAVLGLLVAALNAVPSRRRPALYQAASLGLSVLLLADLAHYRTFHDLLSLQRLGSYPLRTPWAERLQLADALVLLDIALVRGWHRLPLDGGPDFRRLALQASAGLACLGGAILADGGRGTGLDDRVAAAHRLTPVGYHAADLLACLLPHRAAALTPAQRKEVAAWLACSREPQPPGPDHGRLRGRNLLVIQVESLEPFVFGQRVAGREITPCLNALVRQAWTFSNYFEQVREDMSLDADLMVNASVHPARRDPAFAGFPVATLPSLPRTLAAAGYATLAIRPNPGTLWNARAGLAQLGFQRCLDQDGLDLGEAFGGVLTDASLFVQALPWLRQLPRPFYAFLSTQSTHLPFDLPDYTRELPLDPDLDREPMGGYLQAVHYTDKHLGRFLARLADAGLLDGTVLVLTSNHRGVHRFCASAARRSRFREAWWEAPDPRLPLLILAKGLPPRTLEVHGGQVDLMPTLLDLLGLEAPPGVMGRSLLSTRRDATVLADGSIRGIAPEPLRTHLAATGRIADLALRGGYYAQPPTRVAAR